MNTLFNPSTIADHVIQHLTDRGMVGKLYTKYSVATHFNPHEVTYRYWVSNPDGSAETEIEYLVPQDEHPTKITISHDIKDCLENPLREIQHQEYAMVGRGTFNSIIAVKKEVRKKNSLFEIDVQVINHTLPKKIYEETIGDRDITSLTSEEIDGLVGDHNIDEQHQDACAISQLSIRENVSQNLQPDPRIYGRTRYVETRNIVVEKFLDEKGNPINDMDKHAGGCQIQFNDYGLTTERIVKPQVSESRSFMEILKQSPSRKSTWMVLRKSSAQF